MTDVLMIEVSEQEEKIIRIIRKIQFGEVKIIVTDGKPVRIEEVKKSIKL